jgi:predicted Fe-Mo cluster-binding NifX family protein
VKIAVSCRAPGAEAPVEPRFGRAPWYVVHDPDAQSWESLRNESAELAGGAGVRAAQFLIDRGVGVVLTGRCGPHALEVLEAASVDVVTSITGTAGEAVAAHGVKGGR